jgi:hypothetical protein
MGSNRRRVEPTEDWEQIELLFAWPEVMDNVSSHKGSGVRELIREKG